MVLAKVLATFLMISLGVQAGDIQGIWFHPSLMKSVANGKKTATIRARHRDYYKLGDAVAKAKDGVTIDIVIEEIQLTSYIWSDDAVNSSVLRRENLRDTSKEGFYVLLRGLRRFYPTFEEGDPVTIIYFHRKNNLEK